MIRKLENVGLYLIAMILALVVIGIRNYKAIVALTFITVCGTYFIIGCLNSLATYGMII